MVRLFIPRLDTRSLRLDTDCQSLSEQIQDAIGKKLAEEKIVSDPNGVSVSIKKKIDSQGYAYYSSLISIADGCWGNELVVRSLLSKLYTQKDSYRLYVDNRGHFWQLLRWIQDDVEHETLAMKECLFELDMQDFNTRRAVAADMLNAACACPAEVAY